MDDTTVENKQAGLEKAINGFVDQVIHACNKLTSDKRRVCLVLDGVKPFNLKRSTHVRRNALSNEHLDVANRLLRKKGDHTGAINKHAAAHVRFTSETKDLIVKIPDQRSNVHQFSLSTGTDHMPPITYFCSLREADSQVVHLASRCGQKAAIISHDSDLFINGGANDILRITRVDWVDEKLTSRVTTKADILNAFGLRKDDVKDFDLAEMRLAVVGTFSGNDYAQNPRGMALKRICNMVKDNKYKDYNKANELMDKIIEDIPRIYEYDRSRYKQALLQFCSPYVLTSSGVESTRVTFSSIRIDIDQDLLNNMYEDKASIIKRANQKVESGNRYTTVIVDPIPKSITAAEKLDPVTVSSRPKKQSKGTATRSINKPDDTSSIKKRTYKDKSKMLPLGDNGDLVKIHPISRATSTWTAGLYSSVLSSASDRHQDNDKLAIAQAKFITNTIRHEVTWVNTGSRYIPTMGSVVVVPLRRHRMSKYWVGWLRYLHTKPSG